MYESGHMSFVRKRIRKKRLTMSRNILWNTFLCRLWWKKTFNSVIYNILYYVTLQGFTIPAAFHCGTKSEGEGGGTVGGCCIFVSSLCACAIPEDEVLAGLSFFQSCLRTSNIVNTRFAQLPSSQISSRKNGEVADILCPQKLIICE